MECSRPLSSNASSHIAPKRWLLGDVGGTHVRFALWASGTVVELGKQRCDAFLNIESAIRAGIADCDGHVDGVALAIAGPVETGVVRLTNRAWVCDARALQTTLDLEQVILVNDFVANAAGLGGLARSDLVPYGVESPDPTVDGVHVVLGPGTGLGVAALVKHSGFDVVVPSEAGHLACAPAAWISGLVSDANDRVTWERCVSGPGLVALDGALRRAAPERAVAAPRSDAMTIASAAQAGEPSALDTVGVFSSLLGNFSGEMALAWRACAVYITGGVIDGLASVIDVSGFREAFDLKPPHEKLMARVPVARVAVSDLAFRGLTRIIDGRCHAPRAGASRASVAVPVDSTSAATDRSATAGDRR